MTSHFLERELPSASLGLVARWAQQPGSVVLRQPASGGASALYFAPRWQLRQDADAPLDFRGSPFRLPDCSARELPHRLARNWSKAQGQSPCGIVGYLSYDLGARAVGCVHARPLAIQLPELWLGLYDAAVLFGDGCLRLAVADLSPLHREPPSLEELWERRALEFSGLAVQPSDPADRTLSLELPSQQWHAEAIHTIQDYLRRGHVYQVNLTAQIHARGAGSAWPVFEREFQRNPTEFAAHLRVDDSAITCFSPERLVGLEDGWVTTSPIKGTVAADRGAQLRESAKELAEHVMIVDLSRNDLGRVCEYGSVTVERFLRELPLRGLVHLVSDVRGRLRAGAEHEILPALFPGGSITGAPKLRAMEIIREVEATRRGVYTGSVGVLHVDGRAHWNIAIRTAVWRDGDALFGCGGGIVLDSEPEREYEEALLKASSFVESLRADSTAAGLARA